MIISITIDFLSDKPLAYVLFEGSTVVNLSKTHFSMKVTSKTSEPKFSKTKFVKVDSFLFSGKGELFAEKNAKAKALIEKVGLPELSRRSS